MREERGRAAGQGSSMKVSEALGMECHKYLSLDTRDGMQDRMRSYQWRTETLLALASLLGMRMLLGAVAS